MTLDSIRNSCDVLKPSFIPWCSPLYPAVPCLSPNAHAEKRKEIYRTTLKYWTNLALKYWTILTLKRDKKIRWKAKKYAEKQNKFAEETKGIFGQFWHCLEIVLSHSPLVIICDQRPCGLNLQTLKDLVAKKYRDFSKIWEKSPVVKVGEVVWECWRGCCVKPGLQLSLHKLSFLLFPNLFNNLLSLLDIIKEAVSSIKMTKKQIKSWKITLLLANLSLIFVLCRLCNSVLLFSFKF